MSISSITSLPDYSAAAPVSGTSADSSTASSGSDAAPASNNVATIVSAIQSAAAGNYPVAMLDPLKQIVGSGSANIAALVNVAHAIAAENVDDSLIQSIGNANQGAIYTVLQNAYAGKSLAEFYLQNGTPSNT